MASKRIYGTTVKKWAKKVGMVGIPLGVLIYVFLAVNGFIIITGYSGDVTCAGTIEEPCYAYINFTPVIDVFIYPTNDSTWVFNAEPTVRELQLHRTWGKGWREIKFDQKCKGTWCGKPYSDTRPTAEYIYAFRAGRNYSIRFTAYKNKITDTVKWGFGIVDPTWLGYTSDDFFVELIDNKVLGPTSGEAMFKITNPSTFSINTDLDILIESVLGASEITKLLIYETEIIIKNITTSFRVSDNTGCFTIKEIVINNKTQEKINKSYGCETYHIENKYHLETIYEYEEIFGNITLKPKESKIYTIRGYWNAKLGDNSREWIPKIIVAGTKIKQNKWAWWNANWGNRRQINVTNNNCSYALPTNYSINITLNTTGDNFMINGSDVRIVFNNDTELDRVNRTLFNTVNTDIWFATVEEIPACTSDLRYEVFYNFSTAGAPPNNGSKVFLSYTDFDDGTLGEDLYVNASNFEAGSGISFLNNTLGVLLVSSGGVASHYTLYSNVSYGETYPNNSLMEIRMNFSKTDAVGSNFKFGFNNGAGGTEINATYIRSDYNANPKFRITSYSSGNLTTVALSNPPPPANGIWYKYQLIRNNTGCFSIDDVVLDCVDENVSQADMEFFIQYEAGISGKTTQSSIDHILIRKYLHPIPTTSLGDEEIGRVDTNFTAWNGTHWEDPYIYFPTYYCNINESNCTSTVYNASRGDYRIINNGTEVEGNTIQMKLNESLVGSDLEYTCGNQSNLSAETFFQINLTNTYLTVHNGTIAVGDSVDIWCWLNVGTTPKFDKYIEVFANIV